MSRNNLLEISPAGPVLTAPQKRFNSLIRQIEKVRQTLAAWQDGMVAFRQSHAQVLKPLQAEVLAGYRTWVLALDALLEGQSWTRGERRALAEMLCDVTAELLAEDGEDDELKALFARHADVDYDTLQREQVQSMKDLAEAMTGLDLGDDDGLETDSDLFARLKQTLHDHESAEAAERSASTARRRRSAAQERREADARQATQSVREIYRKLASALHPDRETVEAQRQAKTALMQRVNQAYERNDLLALLELQLEIEQIDASHIAKAGEQRLKHYNKVLAEQLEELQMEVARVEMDFRLEFGLQYEGRVDPRKLGELLEHAMRQCRAELVEQQRDLRQMNDPVAAKRWVKRQKQRQRDDAFGFEPF